jgi:hypothetical protein
MKKTSKKVTAEQIAKMADRGEDISKFFTNKGKMMPPVRKIERVVSTPRPASQTKKKVA